MAQDWLLWAGCLSCNSANSVKALKETQSTDPNQGTLLAGLILSLSISGLLKEEVTVWCRITLATGYEPSHRVCKVAYLVPVPWQDKLAGLCQEVAEQT